MNSVYNHAVKQFTTLRKDLSQFEQNITTSPLSLQGSISVNLTSLSRAIGDYESLMKNELDELKLEKAKLRLNTFNNDLKELKSKFQELRKKREEALHDENKTELLKNRRGYNNSSEQSVSDNPYVQQPSQDYRQGMAKEHDILDRGISQLDEILEMGQRSLEELVISNDTLRNIGTKLTGTLNTLGVSTQTMKSIERRAKQDKWLFYGGAILMFVVFCLLIRWLH